MFFVTRATVSWGATNSEYAERRAWYRNKVFRFEHVLVDTELARSAEVHGHEAFDQALHFSDAIISWGRPVVNELSFFELLAVPRLPVEGWNGWKKLQTIWYLQISHSVERGFKRLLSTGSLWASSHQKVTKLTITMKSESWAIRVRR